jgi:hypothetical protein
MDSSSCSQIKTNVQVHGLSAELIVCHDAQDCLSYLTATGNALYHREKGCVCYNYNNLRQHLLIRFRYDSGCLDLAS